MFQKVKRIFALMLCLALAFSFTACGNKGGGSTSAEYYEDDMSKEVSLKWYKMCIRDRQYTYAANNSITLPDFFENRFRDKSRVIKTVSSLFILIFFLLYTASMFKGGAVLFQTVFGISYVPVSYTHLDVYKRQV